MPGYTDRSYPASRGEPVVADTFVTKAFSWPFASAITSRMIAARIEVLIDFVQPRPYLHTTSSLCRVSRRAHPAPGHDAQFSHIT